MHARPDPLTFVGSVGYGLSPDPSYIILRRARKTNMYLLNEAGFGQPLRLPPKVWENKLIDDEINHGTSVKDLTNKVFWLRHPELRGCRLQASCRDLKQLQQEWMRIHAKVSTSKEWRDRLKNLPDFKRPGLGSGQPPPARDSQIANVFIQAHRSRWCIPGLKAASPAAPCHAAADPPGCYSHVDCGGPGDCIRFGTVNDVVRAWQNRGEASSHYLVDRNGDITQMVREANVAFHAGLDNPDSIGIEHADICNVPTPYTTELYERSAALVRDIGHATVSPYASSESIPTTGTPPRSSVISFLTRPIAMTQVRTGTGNTTLCFCGGMGRTLGTRPDLPSGDLIRRPPMAPVAVAPVPVAPQGWECEGGYKSWEKGGTCIPNEFCANMNHSYADHYWRAAANAPGADVVFQFRPLSQAGRYKISLW